MCGVRYVCFFLCSVLCFGSSRSEPVEHNIRTYTVNSRAVLQHTPIHTHPHYSFVACAPVIRMNYVCEGGRMPRRARTLSMHINYVFMSMRLAVVYFMGERARFERQRRRLICVGILCVYM